MISCLDSWIGIRGCGTATPGSGQWINTLPGISLESIDRIADSEQITYSGVWADVQEEAANRFYTDFVYELSLCYQLAPYCDYEAIICANLPKITKAWKYLLGNQLMLERIYTNRINWFTTVSLEAAGELRDLYQVEYENALKQAAKIVNTDECCLECGGNPETVTFLP